MLDFKGLYILINIIIYSKAPTIQSLISPLSYPYTGRKLQYYLDYLSDTLKSPSFFLLSADGLMMFSDTSYF